MMDKIEMSLDDIIKSNKQSKFNKGGRRGGAGGGKASGGGGFKKNTNARNSPTKKFSGVVKGRGRGGITRSKYTRGDVNSAWKHDMFEGARKGAALGTTKLVVSNLDFSVSDSDINELFLEFGPLKAASVHYDRSGRSLGTADVIFERRNDALKALKTYNGVPLDGRPMNILIATSEVPQASAPVARAPRKFVNARGPQQQRKPAGGPRRFGGPQQRGKAGGSGGGAGLRNKKPEVTIDQLNAELDAYTMQA